MDPRYKVMSASGKMLDAFDNLDDAVRCCRAWPTAILVLHRGEVVYRK